MLKTHWFGNFSNEDDVCSSFRIPPSTLDGCDILIAYYTYYDYSGSAYVLFRKGLKLYEVSGGHCSCYGLEGQWSPGEVTVAALRHFVDKGGYGNREYGHALKEILNELES